MYVCLTTKPELPITESKLLHSESWEVGTRNPTSSFGEPAVTQLWRSLRNLKSFFLGSS